MRRTAASLLALAFVAVPSLTACGSDAPAESAADLLAHAKRTLDGTDTLHFVLDSEGAPKTGTELVGGQGDIARPASFEGTLQVVAMGATVDLSVVSVDKTVYAQLPFSSGFTVVDPAKFGFGDPGALIDPDTGISQLLSSADSAKLGDERRVNGEVVREVTARLPGDLVGQLLTSEDPSRPVDARFSVAVDSGELLRAELTGPFFDPEKDGTYTLQLSDFGADVQITAPATG